LIGVACPPLRRDSTAVPAAAAPIFSRSRLEIAIAPSLFACQRDALPLFLFVGRNAVAAPTACVPGAESV